MGHMPPPTGFFPPSGYGYPPPPPPNAGGIPPYPGPAAIHQDPRFQYGPSFDGLYSHGLTTNPYINSLTEDVNMMQHQIYSAAGVGYPQMPIYPPMPGMAPGPMPPPPMPPGGPPPPSGGHGNGGAVNSHGYNQNGTGQKLDKQA